MEITHKQKVTFDNFNSHLLHLKKEIIDVNKELEQKLSEVNELKKEINNLIHDKGCLLTEIDFIINTQEVEKSKHANNIYQLESSKNRIEKDISRLQDDYDRTKNKRDYLDTSIKDRYIIIEHLDKVITDLLSKIDSVSGKKIIIEHLYTNESKEIKDRVHAISKLLADKQNELKKVEQDIQNKKDEYEKINKDMDSIVNNIKTSRDNIEKDRIELEKKEKNLNVLVERFKKQFKKLYPNLEVRI